MILDQKSSGSRPDRTTKAADAAFLFWQVFGAANEMSSPDAHREEAATEGSSPDEAESGIGKTFLALLRVC